MCKQEDYFSKKLIYMHNRKIYMFIFQCHASTGRPKPCKSFGTRDDRGSHLWAEPWVASSGPPSRNTWLKKKKKKTGFLNVASEAFSPLWIWYHVCLFILGGREEEANFWNVHFPQKREGKGSNTIFGQFHCQRVEVLEVFVLLMSPGGSRGSSCYSKARWPKYSSQLYDCWQHHVYGRGRDGGRLASQIVS